MTAARGGARDGEAVPICVQRGTANAGTADFVRLAEEADAR